MRPIDPRELLDALEWRYATKIFDPARTLPEAVWQSLQTALVLSPSSYGLQPYRFLVVADPARRAELLPHSWGQKQVVDASHFVVFTARTVIAVADVDRLIARTIEIRGLPAAALAAYRQMMIGDLVQGPRSSLALHWAARQAYIALGNLLTSAALLGVDACPMEGFVPAEYDRILGLAGTGYAAVVACALGYRAATDKYATLPKVRFDASELVKNL
ncbi:MAG: NAD(P)H-dependent oxidoreductase [Verrucomicrobiota bacterium]|jgi:nitroreductase